MPHLAAPHRTAPCTTLPHQFEGDDGGNQGLYDEERQQELAAAQQQESARRQAVGGLLNPYEVPDDMADL